MRDQGGGEGGRKGGVGERKSEKEGEKSRGKTLKHGPGTAAHTYNLSILGADLTSLRLASAT